VPSEDSGNAPLRPAAASDASCSEPPKPDFYTAFDRIVYDSLRPASAALGVLYVILAVSHALTQPEVVAVPMTIVASGSAGALGGLYYLLGRRQFPLNYANPLGMIVFAVALLNSVMHLGLTFEPRQSTNFALVIVGAGCFFLRRRWLIASVLSAAVTWICAVSFMPPSPDWLHFAFMLLMATVLSVLVYTVRFRTFRRH
jgi:hypothetical protein